MEVTKWDKEHGSDADLENGMDGVDERDSLGDDLVR
jgi:hypothetical protein